jgi:hypothetical protein
MPIQQWIHKWIKKYYLYYNKYIINFKIYITRKIKSYTNDPPTKHIGTEVVGNFDPKKPF